MIYKFALGYNVALASMTPFLWQPRTDSTVQPVLRSYGISGAVHEQGLYIPLLYSAFDDPSDYLDQLTQLDLAANLTREITLYCPNEAFVPTRYNGIVTRPMQGEDVRRSGYFLKDVTFTVNRLVAL